MGANRLTKSMEEDVDTGAIALCALRYCIGRRTYMPSLVVDWVKRHWGAFPESDKNVILRDVQQEVNSGRDLGDDCDYRTWTDFLKWISAQKDSNSELK